MEIVVIFAAEVEEPFFNVVCNAMQQMHGDIHLVAKILQRIFPPNGIA